MTAKISLLILVTWGILLGVENLANHFGAQFVSFPGAHGSPVINYKNEINSKNVKSIVSSNSPDNDLTSSNTAANGGGGGHGGGRGGHQSFSAGGSLSSASALAQHHLKTKRQTTSFHHDYDEEPVPLQSHGVGAIGCKFSKTLCDAKLEWCFDDFAFGSCLRIYEPPEPSQLYRYDLSKADTHSLEKEMEKLYGLGYRWGHAYTQCVLQNLLDAIRYGTSWELAICSHSADQDLGGAMKAFEDDVDPFSLAIVKFTPSDNNPHADFADELYRPPPPLVETSAASSPAIDKFSSATTKFSQKDGTSSLSSSSSSDSNSQDGNANSNPKSSSSSSSSIKSQLKALPPRQQLPNSILQGPEEEMVEEAIAEYLASRQSAQQRTSWKTKKAYPYRSGIRQQQQQQQRQNEEVDGLTEFDLAYLEERAREEEEDVEEQQRRKLREEAELEAELEEEIEAAALLEALAAAAASNGEKENAPGIWAEAPALSIPPSEQLVDASILQETNDLLEPKIFSSLYNTPNLFRHGIETRDEQAVLSQDPLINPNSEIADGVLDDVDNVDSEFFDVPLALPLMVDDTADDSVWTDRQVDSPQASRQQQALYELTNDGHGGFEEVVKTSQDEMDNPVYTEGGLVYLNNNPKRRFLIDMDPSGRGVQETSGFERRERLDVKKPGPWYKTVNNFGFDYDEKDRMERQHANVNPEFEWDEGPAEMFADLRAVRQDDQQVLARPQMVSGNAQESQVEEVSSNEPNRPAAVSKTQDTNANVVKDSLPSSDSETLTASKKSSSPVFIGGGNVRPIDDHLEFIDTSSASIAVKEPLNHQKAETLLQTLAKRLGVKRASFSDTQLSDNGNTINFKVDPQGLSASEVAQKADSMKDEVAKETGIHILSASPGPQAYNFDTLDGIMAVGTNRFIFATFFLALLIVSLIIAAMTIYLIRRNAKQHEKIARLAQDDMAGESCKDYQDLCRARMASKNNEKVEPIRAVQRVASTLSRGSDDGTSSSRSSTSSWNDEPVLTNMDISTGHMVLSYMEDHLKKKDRLDQEWVSLCGYEADPCSTAIAEKSDNKNKNRYTNSLPYDHSRVILNDLANLTSSDYINASTITDHDPRNPAYIATQGPLQNTTPDFWQMVWEQGAVVIVTLTRLADNGTALCHRYWPEEGSELHHIYEVHLVSEHIWCDEYLVRSFYLKNLKTGETRTVTQFHFLAWPENGVPSSTKALLEFRRKVNKSYRGRSCPIIVHCSDGAGRTGTYCLIDMVLNRMAKGAKEIDIAASLEHIRDQRQGMVRTKQQFEFVLMAVAEEVHAILKALPQ